MNRKTLLVLVVFAFFLVGSVIWAQTRREPDVMAWPPVLTGENIGIRLSAAPHQGGKVVGTLVVKINGQWVDVVAPAAIVPVGK
jgi:prepilin signal peptidase PulO-like enzyme (type II secretory pathway)